MHPCVMLALMGLQNMTLINMPLYVPACHAQAIMKAALLCVHQMRLHKAFELSMLVSSIMQQAAPLCMLIAVQMCA